jgi:hypothetical protein
MGLVIKDGRTGNTGRVDGNQRLHVASITEEEKDHANESGEKFNVNTGDITLTNATKTTVLYLKNNDDDPLIVTSLIYNLGNTTSGTGDVVIDIVRNPTTGDIITNKNAVEMESNQNYGSNEVMTIDAYKGATGETAVNGSKSVSTRSASNTGRIVIALGSVRLEKGSSLAVDYTPPTSNTSQICQFAAACYVKSQKVSDDT